MPEEVFETPQPIQPIEPKSTDWTKMILATVLGLALLAASACAGYYYGTQETSKLKDQISNLQPKTQNQEEPITSPTPNPSVSNLTAGWETYANNRCGYSLKYPPLWNLLPEPEDSVIGATMIYSYKEGDKLEGNNWLKVQLSCGNLKTGEEPRTALDRINTRDPGFGVVPQITSIEQTTVGGKLAYKQVAVLPAGESVLEYYIFYRDGSVLSIGFTPSGTVLMNVVEGMLSTFKFLD